MLLRTGGGSGGGGATGFGGGGGGGGGFFGRCLGLSLALAEEDVGNEEDEEVEYEEVTDDEEAEGAEGEVQEPDDQVGSHAAAARLHGQKTSLPVAASVPKDCQLEKRTPSGDTRESLMQCS